MSDQLVVSLRNFSIYTLLSILQKASTFLLLPVYTFYLKPEDFGIVSIATAIATIVPPLVMMNTSEFLYFTTLKKDSGWEREVSSIICFQVLVVIGVLLTVVLGSWLLDTDHFTLFGIPFFPYLVYTLAFAILSVIFNSYSLILQGLNEVKNFSYLNISFSVLSAALIILLMIPFDMKALSFIYANVILYSAYAIAIVFIVGSRFGLSLFWIDLKRGLKYSAPLIPHTLSHWGKGYLDRVFLGAFVSTSAAGLFHFASTISSLIIVGLDAFVKVNNPMFFEAFEDLSKRESIVSRLHLAAVFFSIMGIFLSFFSKELMWFFDVKYEQSYVLLPFLIAGNLVYLIYLGLVNVLFIKQKTLLVSALTFTSGTISSLGSYFLIQNFGLQGAAWSHLFSNLTIAIVVYVGVQRVDNVRWKIFQLLLLLVLPLAGYAIDVFQWNIELKILLSFACIIIVLLVARREITKALRSFGINMKLV